jgi:hypothetical protein
MIELIDKEARRNKMIGDYVDSLRDSEVYTEIKVNLPSSSIKPLKIFLKPSELPGHIPDITAKLPSHFVLVTVETEESIECPLIQNKLFLFSNYAQRNNGNLRIVIPKSSSSKVLSVIKGLKLPHTEVVLF